MPRGKKSRKYVAKPDKKEERALRQAMRREKRLNKSDPEFHSLSSQLQSQGLKMKDVLGDGSLADQLLLLQSNEITHRELRSNIIHYMRHNGEHFSLFMEDDDMTFEEYLSDLSKDGTYGGNESIVAFSRLYNCCVVIHQPNLPRWEVHPEVGVATRSYAQIAYLHGDHYCSVIPIEEGDVSPVIKQTQNVSPMQDKRQTTVPHSENIEKFTGISDELNMLLASTGSHDSELAERILIENDYDVGLAIVEMLQVMSLNKSMLVTSHSESLSDKGDSKQESHKPSDVKKKLSTNSKMQDHPHISNRQRKEKAKRERKERRIEEKRKQSNKKPSSDDCLVEDSLGSLTI